MKPNKKSIKESASVSETKIITVLITCIIVIALFFAWFVHLYMTTVIFSGDLTPNI